MGPHSLCYEVLFFPKPLPRDHWCKIQGKVDEEPFLSSDCSGVKTRAIGILGGKVKDTETWEHQSETLKDLAERFRQELLDIKLQNWTSSDSLKLSANMTCQQNTGGHLSTSWKLCLNEQACLHFNSNQRKWTEIHPGLSSLKEQWKNDKELCLFLYWTLMEDCGSWLTQFLEHWKESLETRAQPTTLAVAESRSKTTMLSPGYLLLILTSSILLGMTGEFFEVAGVMSRTLREIEDTLVKLLKT
ncbi:UL16-binding protein 1-like [Octodon degus]|uniref:UL16-binding protein 1-like n=1 Tax=Octodon degus TaxID=10160 RepID=A0A6P3FGQ7_OCTDE|nr:UL16-binding protein 1-like [Octodon degus]